MGFLTDDEHAKKIKQHRRTEAFEGPSPETLRPPPEGRDWADWLENKLNDRKRFNRDISSFMLDKGKKGIIYQPQRYNEWEVRMFDPENVSMLDLIRPEKRPALGRLYGANWVKREVGNTTIADFEIKPSKRKLFQQWHEKGEGQSGSSLGELVYGEIDLDKLRRTP